MTPVIASGGPAPLTLMVGAVVLAAGASRRLGRPKQLVPFGGEPLVRRAAQAALEAGARPVAVVLGASQATVAAALAPLDTHPDVRVVPHAAWDDGLGSSLAAGVAALGASDPLTPGASASGARRAGGALADRVPLGAQGVDAILVVLADQPLVQAHAFRRLVRALRTAPAAVAAAAAYGGTLGAPAVIRAAWLAARCAAPLGDRGVGALLRSARPGAVVPVPVPEAAFDVDTLADVERLSTLTPAAPNARATEQQGGARVD